MKKSSPLLELHNQSWISFQKEWLLSSNLNEIIKPCGVSLLGFRTLRRLPPDPEPLYLLVHSLRIMFKTLIHDTQYKLYK